MAHHRDCSIVNSSTPKLEVITVFVVDSPLVKVLWFPCSGSGDSASSVLVLQFLLLRGHEVLHFLPDSHFSAKVALSIPKWTSLLETLVQTQPFSWRFPPNLV